MNSSHTAQGVKQCQPLTISALAKEVIGKPIPAGDKVFEVVKLRFFLVKEANNRWSAASFTVDLVAVEGEDKIPFQLPEAITFPVEYSPGYYSRENLRILGPTTLKTKVTSTELLQTVSSRLNFGV